MLIKESTLRRIIKEEARRVLREQAPPTVAAPANPAWAKVSASLAALQASISTSNPSAFTNIALAIAGWADCLNPASPKAVAVSRSLAANANQNANGQLAAALVSLAGISSMSGGPVTTLNGTADGAENLQSALAPVSNDIVANMKAALTPPVAGAPADLVYSVKSGDSLSKILKTYYNIPATAASVPLYTAFAKTSKIANPNVITVGQRITLPQSLTISNQTFTRKPAA